MLFQILQFGTGPVLIVRFKILLHIRQMNEKIPDSYDKCEPGLKYADYAVICTYTSTK